MNVPLESSHSTLLRTTQQRRAKAAGHGTAEPGDVALVRGVADGDAAALRQLYDRYSGYVYAACHRVLRNDADAQDVMIQVFTSLWERPDQFAPERGSLVTYLMILARSRATDLRRSQGRRLQLVQQRAQELASPEVDEATPEEAAWVRERREKVDRALAKLNDDQRQAVELAFLEGLSHREIADRLDTPLGTVKTRIRLGLIHLRDSLRTYWRGDQP